MNDPDGRIDDELRSAGAEWRSTRPAPDKALDPTLFASLPTRAGGRRMALASVVGVGAVLVAVVLIVVSLPSRNDIATTSPSPSAAISSPVIQTSPRPTAITPAATLGNLPVSAVMDLPWSTVTADKLPYMDRGFDDLEGADGKFLATGHACSDTCSVFLFESVDGESWAQIAELTTPANETGLFSFYQDDSAGTLAFARGLYKGPGAGLWRSDDGSNWTFLGSESAFDGSECGSQGRFATDIDDVYRAGNQLVAIGLIYCDASLLPAAWTSTDGQTWTRTDAVPMYKVFEVNGSFVGLDREARNSQIWQSGDGLNWTAVPYPSTRLDMTQVASGLLLIARSADASQETLATSTDGISWNSIGQISAQYTALASDGIRAAMLDQSSDVWVSSQDGASWDRYDLSRAGSLANGVAISGNRVIAWSDADPILWTAELPTQTASPPPSPTPRPSASPTTPTTGPTPSPAIQALPEDAIKAVTADVNRAANGTYAQDGPRVAYTTKDGLGLQVADLTTGAITNIATTTGNDRILWVALSSDEVAWVAGKYAGNRDLAPCAQQGALTWRVLTRNLITGEQRSLDEGTNTVVGGCAAFVPPVAVDGDQIAYVVEDPTPSSDIATKIVVKSISTGAVVREIKSDVLVGDLDMSGGTVAYVEGTPTDDPYAWLDSTALKASPANDQAPKLIALDLDDMTFAGGRAAWIRNGMNDLWTGGSDVPSYQVTDNKDPIRGNAWASGNLVSFATDSALNIWDAQDYAIHSFTPQSGVPGLDQFAPNAVSANGGWLVWTGYGVQNGQIVTTIAGLPLSDVSDLAP